MNIYHGSSKTLARAVRKAGPFLTLRNGKRRFISPRYRWDDGHAPVADWSRDVLLAYPDRCQNAPEVYPKLVEFYRGNKFQQWQVCKDYFECPKIDKPPYVVRPLRHEGGIGFEVTDTLPPEARSKTHYWRSLWERSCEYRVFFVYGKPVLTLLKKVPEGTAQNIPWNAGVSSFVTVHDHDNDRLRHSKFYEKADAFFKALPFHLCAVDVLYRKHRHRVVEVNFSPGVLIDANLQTLTTALLRKTNDTTRNDHQSRPEAVSANARPAGRPHV